MNVTYQNTGRSKVRVLDGPPKKKEMRAHLLLFWWTIKSNASVAFEAKPRNKVRIPSKADGSSLTVGARRNIAPQGQSP